MVRLEGAIFSQDRYYYLRPTPGEKVPIQILNFRRVFAAWSHKLKNTLYFEKAPEELEEEGLKRVREIVLLQVYDWFAGREGLVELTEPEFEQFKKIGRAHV